jgi:recombination protein RecT
MSTETIDTRPHGFEPPPDGPGGEAHEQDAHDREAQGNGCGRVQPLEAVRQALELLKPRLAVALPPHLPADRLLRVVMTVLQNTPVLLECDRASLYRAVMTCAQLGLEPDGILGQAFLVPHRGRVQFLPGYRGLITLARNSGEVLSLNAQAVHEKDRFEVAFGLDERLEHVPAEGDRGEITHFYAYARFRGGGHHFDVMSRAEVDAVRDRTQSYRAFQEGKIEETPWVPHYPEMGKKTVIRRIARYLPMSVQKAAAITELYEAGKLASLDDDGEIAVDFEEEAAAVEPAAPEPAPAAPPRSRLDVFADAEEWPAAAAPFAAPAPVRREPATEGALAGGTEEDDLALPIPAHQLRILQAVVQRDMPIDVLAGIVGMPLEEVTEEHAQEILREIKEWEPEPGEGTRRTARRKG